MADAFIYAHLLSLSGKKFAFQILKSIFSPKFTILDTVYDRHMKNNLKWQLSQNDSPYLVYNRVQFSIHAFF